jgi:hypothetical protein
MTKDKKEGVPLKKTGTMVGSSTRKASSYAAKANPKLKRVKAGRCKK